MHYLKYRLLYDVKSEFGNFRLLLDTWLKLFKGDNIRLIEFYEGVNDDRDTPRHEALIELFLVTLAATIIGGITVEEYKTRRDRIGRVLLILQRKCRLSLEYLFDMDALKYLQVNGIIDHKEYLRLAKQLKKRLRRKMTMPEEFKRKLEPYYTRFGMSSNSDIFDALGKTSIPRTKLQSKRRQNYRVPKNAITLSGLAASPGVVSGRIRNIRKPEDVGELKVNDVGVFHIYTPYMVDAIVICVGIIGTKETGGMTGHLAISARGIGKPAVVAVNDDRDMLSDGKIAIVDGNAGKVHLVSEKL